MFAARAQICNCPARVSDVALADLAATGATFVSRADVDPLHQRPTILNMAKAYLGPGGDPRNPLASPLYGDPGGLPPLLIQCGDHETILDDSVRFAERAHNAGVAVEFEVYPSMIHVFQAFGELSAARQALAGPARSSVDILPDDKSGPRRSPRQV